jgi:hypothetical protein
MFSLINIEATHVVFTWQAHERGDLFDIIEADVMTAFSLAWRRTSEIYSY